MRNVVLRINSKQGFKAVVCRRKKGKYIEVYIVVSESSSTKCMPVNNITKLIVFYNRYSKSLKFNVMKYKTVGAIFEHDVWITVRKEDLRKVIKEIIRVF